MEVISVWSVIATKRGSWSCMVIYGHIWSYMVIYILPVSTSLFPKRTLGTNLAHLAVGFLRRVWSTTSSGGILPRGSSTLEKSTWHMGASWFQCMTSGPLYDPGMDVCMYICIYIYIYYIIYIHLANWLNYNDLTATSLRPHWNHG